MKEYEDFTYVVASMFIYLISSDLNVFLFMAE